MLLNEIVKEYKAKKEILIGKYRSLYEEELIEILKDVGMYNTDVRQISTGKTGRFSICPMSYSSVECNVKFVPYTVKGQFSKNPVFICYCATTQEDIKGVILNEFVLAESDN